MYLIAFVTLIISLISVYTQVLAVEVARLAAEQSAAGKAMIDWHNGAVSMAASIINTNMTNSLGTTDPDYNTVKSTGCRLVQPVLVGTTLAICPGPIQDPTTATHVGANTPLNGGTAAAGYMINNTVTPSTILQIFKPTTTAPYGVVESVRLPPEFRKENYQFYSALYRDSSGADEVITYLPPTTPTTGNPSGFLQLPVPGAPPLALSASDLATQIVNASNGRYLHGFISSKVGGNTVLQTTSTTALGAFVYILPAAFKCTAAPCPLDGALAIVSSPDGL